MSAGMDILYQVRDFSREYVQQKGPEDILLTNIVSNELVRGDQHH